MKLYRSIALAGLITAMLTPAAFAHGFRDHRGASAMMPCLAVAQPQQKENLKKLFADSKQTLKTDHQKVRDARNALNEAILSGSKDVGAQENAVSKAQLQMLHDHDMMATQFCGQLSKTQRTAAATLYQNMRKLHEQSRAQARSYMEAAKSAAGSSTTTQKAE